MKVFFLGTLEKLESLVFSISKVKVANSCLLVMRNSSRKIDGSFYYDIVYGLRHFYGDTVNGSNIQDIAFSLVHGIDIRRQQEFFIELPGLSLPGRYPKGRCRISTKIWQFHQGMVGIHQQ